jgi:hypothetical protein
LDTSRSEVTINDLERELRALGSAGPGDVLKAQLKGLQSDIDGAYGQFFDVGDVELEDGSRRLFEHVSETELQRLGREEPKVSVSAFRCLLFD